MPFREIRCQDKKPPQISRSGKAATKGYWKCHGKKAHVSRKNLFRGLRAKYRGKKSLLLLERSDC
jgi:hypothetical protein